MADPDVSKSREADQSDSEEEEDEEAGFQAIVDTLGPVERWSNSTILALKAAVNAEFPEAYWHERSEWTERAVNAILSPHQGWNWRKLKRCAKAEYFSLPIHTITLLNDLYYSDELDEVDERVEQGEYDMPMNVLPHGGLIGYPIVRVDYSNDTLFQLYKYYWDRFMELHFYRGEALDREDISWHWVEDQSRLDGIGPREVQRQLHALKGQAFPVWLANRSFCLMLDKGAMESLLWPYGPPATSIHHITESYPYEDRISFLPYVVAVSINWHEVEPEDEAEDEANYTERDTMPDDGKYHGWTKVHLQSVFSFWMTEEILGFDESFEGRDSVWADMSVTCRLPIR